MSASGDANQGQWGRSDDFEKGWSVAESRRKQKFLLVFGVKASISLVEFKIACGDVGLNWLVSRTVIRRIGNCIKIFVRNTLARVFTNDYVRRLSRLMRVRYGWRCVYDVMSVGVSSTCKQCNNVDLVNRFDLLQHEKSGECDKTIDVHINCNVVSCNKSVVNNKHRGIRIGTWNFRVCVMIEKH